MFRKPCGSNGPSLAVVTFALAGCILLSCCFQESSAIAIAPSTFGTAIARAGKISNTLKETTAWKTLTSHPNSLVQLLPSRAMRVVQEVVRSFRKDTHVVVTTSAGKIRGRFQKFRSGERGGYYSFKGIRYGQAPVGERRFRAAEPERNWSGIRDASREGNSCPHKNMILDTYKGNEDCLFLNVFTVKMPKGDYNPDLPVMVWLHGGGYSFGSGNTFLYGPDYLVAENIVLVTLNYRLGPLGFLTAGPDAPGNQGLKDQILALKWVRNNIAAFGGDPNHVTIFGESAGGSSVQMLLLAPMAKGLFHRAISESGSALNPWAMGESSVARAARLAANLGYVGANDTKEILEFLRRVPAMKLVEASPTTLTEEDFRNNIGLPFVPVVEGYWNKPGEEAVYYETPFITESPQSMYEQHKFHKNIPYMTGYNTHEAMLFIRRLRKNPKLLEIIENDFTRLVPRDLNVTDERERVTREIRQFYLGNKQVGIESVDEMIALLTDLMFVHGIMRTVRNHAKYSNMPVYMYRFSFDGALGLYKRMLGLQRPGVCHGDELGYLFKFGFFNLSLDPKSMEVLVKNRMVRMWTNFAKYGNPTPSNLNDDLLTTSWLPVNGEGAMNNLTYMDITTHLQMKNNPELERQQFWDYMYEHYNGNAM
ncbi:juvenile hormone esterase isoform X1 [Stomoxys calcitrans]|uniref:juvenile hormone esterase isoform X1 n=3 Tax=Stomoxys calcitrans TaxID=35570 RepID=UPI0027E35D77|nr:juvenile hormone esterase isoform X1 [Stomoxys calcitrans]XP_013119598.2 juvenile hormone esterase isoform X1 [Stomoxys calcitrans]XP_059219119.1 juvenile hormone esterase isoform X1 [Stomoxys calcitrans]